MPLEGLKRFGTLGVPQVRPVITSGDESFAVNAKRD
jgi:hypothetical protein